ncbi:hypothetical protein C5167_043151 [Papaver somniferum]|uniref:Uncharacterized protein n=1 Tax=Papaver somniferum TaxID=3469 RepID=A0A4Y7L7I6_PAPSO|nr:hypothetical protein C5167_043151 [Papaver somniferum]
MVMNLSRWRSWNWWLLWWRKRWSTGFTKQWVVPLQMYVVGLLLPARLVNLVMVFAGRRVICLQYVALRDMIQDGCGHEAVAGRVAVAEMDDMVLSGGGLNCWLSTYGVANM